MNQRDICPCCDPITGTGLTGRCTCGGTDIDHNMLRSRLDIEPIRARHAYGDEEFIRHCEDDVAALLAEVDRLRGILAARATQES